VLQYCTVRIERAEPQRVAAPKYSRGGRTEEQAAALPCCCDVTMCAGPMRDRQLPRVRVGEMALLFVLAVVHLWRGAARRGARHFRGRAPAAAATSNAGKSWGVGREIMFRPGRKSPVDLFCCHPVSCSRLLAPRLGRRLCGTGVGRLRCAGPHCARGRARCIRSAQLARRPLRQCRCTEAAFWKQRVLPGRTGPRALHASGRLACTRAPRAAASLRRALPLWRRAETAKSRHKPTMGRGSPRRPCYARGMLGSCTPQRAVHHGAGGRHTHTPSRARWH
jgi:hypothetical protein